MKFKSLAKAGISLVLAAVMVSSIMYAPVPMVNMAQGAAVKQESLAEANISEQGTGEYETDRFIVKYRHEAGWGGLETAVKDKIKKVKKVKGRNLELISTNAKMKASELIAEIKGKNADSSIEYIQPDYEMTMASNDPYLDSQWGLGSTGANMTSAWEQADGSGVTVAVIDTGVDITHEDISQNIWTNTSEIPNNGMDDDNNGYVDDVNGWNFYDNTNEVHSQALISDEQHGTHIAGTIAAVKDNGTGVAGVAPAAKVMPLKVFKDGKAYTSDIIEAIDYAQSKGAKVANCSWGTSYDNPALKEAIEGSSMLFVCAAGNSGINIDSAPVYPASFTSSNIIAVASMEKNGTLSSFSNFGEVSVDVAAPGEDIMSTLPGNTYGQLNGTSMAAAFVSGEAALVMSKEGLTNLQEVRSEIIASIYKEGSLSGIVGSGGRVSINGERTEESVGTVPVENIQEGPSVQNSVYSEEYQQEFTAFSSGTYSTPQSATAQVISLPSDGLTGELDATLKGNTVINLLGNVGDCEDINKFGKYHTTAQLDSSNVVFGKNSIKISVGSGYGSGAINCSTGSKLKPNSYYILSAYLKNGNSTKLKLVINKGSGLAASSSGVSDSSKFNCVSIKFSTPSDVAGSSIEAQIIGDAGQYGYVDGIMLNEVTAGEYNNSTESQLLSKYQYVNGVSSTSFTRLKSIGKNLFDGKLEIGVYDYATGEKFNNTSWVRNKGLIPIQPNTSYILSWYTQGASQLTMYDINGRFISGTNIGVSSGTPFVSNNNAYYLGFFINNTDVTQKVQLEKNTAQTAYEPYKESIGYLCNDDVELSSLGGIADEVNINNGLYTQRTKKIFLNGNLSWELFNSSDFSTIAYASVGGWAGSNNAVPNTISMVSGNNDFKFESVLQFADNGLPQVAITSDGRLWVALPKSSIGGSTGYSNSLDGFVEYLAGKKTTLIYQLANPQISKLSNSPLICFAGGTINLDNAIKNTRRYTNSGIGVSNPAFPIKSIESVYKLNNGVMSLVDSGKIRCTPGSNYFTIDGAASGELYEFTYTYDSSLSTLPTVEFSTPVDTQAQIDGNTDMIKQLSDVTNYLMEEIKSLKAQRVNAGPFKVNCIPGTPFNLVVTASNSKDFSSRKFTVIYKPSEVKVNDLNAETAASETTEQTIAGTNMAITKHDKVNGVIEFIIYNPVDETKTWSGAVNTLIFEPLSGCTQANVAYTVE